MPDSLDDLKLLSSGKVREIYADGDVYMSIGGKTIFQAEKVYINVIENRRVIVDGHADSRPVTVSRKENPDNWVLGARRAAACPSRVRR